MKILAILGSPHGMKGNTARLLEEVAAGAMEIGAEVETLSLARLTVKPCIGCDHCHRLGRCSIDDDFEAIKENLAGCDGFVIASPNYIFSVSAQMKAFMDRCCGVIHCLALEGKYGAVVETSGGGEDAEVVAYMERFVASLGAVSVGGIGSPMVGERIFPDQPALFGRARELGRELVRSIGEKRVFAEQDAARRRFAQRMKRLVTYKKDFWSYEYDYWLRSGRM